MSEIEIAYRCVNIPDAWKHDRHSVDNLSSHVNGVERQRSESGCYSRRLSRASIMTLRHNWCPGQERGGEGAEGGRSH